MATQENRTESISGRLDGIDTRITSLDSRIDARFNALESRMESRFNLIIGLQFAILVAVLGAMVGGLFTILAQG